MTQTNAKNELTLEIDSLSYGPYGIGRLEGKAVMIPNTAPGDTVAARIVDARDRYAVGEVLRLIVPSSLRQAPPCPYVSECGGCPWQHLRYDAQLKAKQQSVEDALRRIGKLEGFELRPIISSPQDYHYRRRIRLQCRDGGRVGFFRAFSHDLVEIDGCLIADDALNGVIDPVRRWIRELNTAIEHVEIVTGDEANQIVVAGKAAEEFVPRDDATCSRLLDQATGIAGLVLHGRNWRRTWGQTTISLLTEDGMCLKLNGDVFSQVNPGGNRRILSELLAAGEFENDDRVLELFCGAGNFTLSIAKRAREVVAVEGYRPSIDSGRRSAQFNGLGNIRWICSSAHAAVQQLKKRRERFSRIVLDPPRSGAKGIDRDLPSLGADKIVYISCDPTTLARDVGALAKHGYKLTLVQPIDLFPHTFHVEAVAVMTR